MGPLAQSFSVFNVLRVLGVLIFRRSWVGHFSAIRGACLCCWSMDHTGEQELGGSQTPGSHVTRNSLWGPPRVFNF